MEGSATLTTDTSRITMNCPTQQRMRIQSFRRSVIAKNTTRRGRGEKGRLQEISEAENYSASSSSTRGASATERGATVAVSSVSDTISRGRPA